MIMTQAFYAFMTAFFLVVIMVPYLLRWALDAGIVDVPDERKSHQNLVPRIGGVAICISFLLSMLLNLNSSYEIRGIMAGALVIFFTGLADDLKGLTPKQKFIGEIVACLVTITIGRLYLQNLGDLFGLGPILLPLWLAIPFTVFAVVGVVNAINLIDGLDGLAGCVTVIALSAFILMGYHVGHSNVIMISAVLVGGVLGFLKYNVYPARIFMGDSGSLVMGFVLAFLGVYLAQPGEHSVKPVVPLVILGVPIFDTLWVIAKRLARGRNPFSPDRTHVHHIFLDIGFQHRFTVIIICAMSMLWALVAVFLHEERESLLFAGYLLLSALFYLGISMLHRSRKRFRFFSQDPSAGIRESALYQRISDRIAAAAPGLAALILVVCLIAAVFTQELSYGALRVGSVMIFACLGLLYLTHDAKNNYVIIMFYFAGLVLVSALYQHDDYQLPYGISLNNFTNLLFAGIFGLTGLRFIFHKPGESLLSGADFLILGVSLFLATVDMYLVEFTNIAGVIAKGIALYLALKVVVAHGLTSTKVAQFSMLLALIIIVARGFF